MCAEPFDLILSSTGTLTVPAAVLADVEAAFANGARSVTLRRRTPDKGELEVEYDQEIADAIAVIEQVRKGHTVGTSQMRWIPIGGCY
jgi:hypothetical protein